MNNEEALARIKGMLIGYVDHCNERVWLARSEVINKVLEEKGEDYFLNVDYGYFGECRGMGYYCWLANQIKFYEEHKYAIWDFAACEGKKLGENMFEYLSHVIEVNGADNYDTLRIVMGRNFIDNTCILMQDVLKGEYDE